MLVGGTVQAKREDAEVNARGSDLGSAQPTAVFRSLGASHPSFADIGAISSYDLPRGDEARKNVGAGSVARRSWCNT